MHACSNVCFVLCLQVHVLEELVRSQARLLHRLYSIHIRVVPRIECGLGAVFHQNSLVGNTRSVGTAGDLHGRSRAQGRPPAVCFTLRHGCWRFHLDLHWVFAAPLRVSHENLGLLVSTWDVILLHTRHSFKTSIYQIWTVSDCYKRNWHSRPMYVSMMAIISKPISFIPSPYSNI